jgi:hypothetical protein
MPLGHHHDAKSEPVMVMMMVVVIIVVAVMMVVMMVVIVVLHQLNFRLLHAGKVVAEKNHLGVLHRLEQIRIGIGGGQGRRDGACRIDDPKRKGGRSRGTQKDASIAFHDNFPLLSLRPKMQIAELCS